LNVEVICINYLRSYLLYEYVDTEAFSLHPLMVDIKLHLYSCYLHKTVDHSQISMTYSAQVLINN